MKELEFSEKSEKEFLEKKEFIEKVNSLRSSLNIPKNSYNKFGNFKYRSLPDIFGGIQGELTRVGLYLEITDELISNPLCIKSKASLSDENNQIESISYAMIGTKTNKDGKSNFDMSQETGSATSYARKYACEALFLLADDNCSDSLSGENSSVQKAVQKTTSATPPTQDFKIEETATIPNDDVKCPACKNAALNESDKVIGCSDWKSGCKFSVWKNGSDLNLEDIKTVLSGNNSRTLTFQLEDGSLKDASLYLDGTDIKRGMPVPETAPF